MQKKYIRTKDKIYEVTNNKYGVFEENGVFKIHCENMGHHWDSELEVIKQADTPEELCDGFYVQIDDWNFDTTHLFDNLEKAIEDFEDWKSYSDRKGLEYEIEVYGFIKTSKGLIYVAKLKENGAMKLI